MERGRSLTVHGLPALRSAIGRVLRPGRTSAPASSPGPQATERSISARLEAVEAQLGHLEAALEGLQDAVHRRALLEDERNEELQRRTRPSQIARDLSNDARDRGL
jgi:hypothetical protein